MGETYGFAKLSLLALIASIACGRTPLDSAAAAKAEGGSAGIGTRGFAQISAGAEYACGLRVDGSASCWGDNTYGQTIFPAGTFTEISAGWGHTCGLRADGSATCWGDNSYGQAIPLAGAFTQISAGGTHTCGLRSNGGASCWGEAYASASTPASGIFTPTEASAVAAVCSKLPASVIP